MILENEIKQIENERSSNQRFKKSIIAFGLFVISIASNVPGYFFPVKHHHLMITLTVLSLLSIIIAIIFSFINITGYLKSLPIKGWKAYLGFALNLLVISITGYNVALMIDEFISH